MRGVYNVAQVRAAEDALLARLPEGALMARAATGLAVECAALLDRVYGAHVALLVGAGNNGGDTLYAGAALARRGARVRALLLEPARAHAGGRAALERAGGRVVAATPEELAGAELVVDGMLGIGGRGGLRSDAAALATAAAGTLTVACDVPSGVDADTGAVEGDAVSADVTVTFGALKAGLLVGAGAERAGEVRLVHLGLAPELPEPQTFVLEAADVAALVRAPGPEDDKYTRGVVGVVAGSAAYGGAGVLTTGAAAGGGAGYVRYAGRAGDAVRAHFPNVVVHDGAHPAELRVQAWAIGPGIGTDDDARGLLLDVLSSEVPVIVDADGISLLAADTSLVRGRSAATVLTPHDREFARIADGPSADRLGSARAAAAELGATVLLKGNATVVAAPDGRAWINRTGTPWLATAGSGDVLTGLIGALLASGLEPPLAAAAGAFVHGVAGQLAAAVGPPTSADVLGVLRRALHLVAAG